MIIYPILVPLLTAILSILLRNKPKIRDYTSLAGSTTYLLIVGAFASKVLSQGAVSYQAGGWPAPFGITLVADSLSVLMLLLTAVIAFATNLYSWGYIEDKGKDSGYYAFLHFMITGMSGAFITGDIFNLFVMFELVLMSSYALVAYSGGKESLFISMKYVVLNLIGSSLMLVAIGGLYSVTGTLNMADMAQILSQSPETTAPVLGLSIILFCVFAIKSGLVPFHFWAPPVYSNSPPPASALMAGISKKVGIYAVIRLYITVFSQAKVPGTAILYAGKPITDVLGILIGVIAALTVLVGGIGGINRGRLDKLLSYSSIGQIGFIYIPITVAMITGSQAALTAALIYVISHAISKPALFMISGLIEKGTGTLKLEELGGLSEQSFGISAAFFISAFSLVGIPPLLGFFAKFLAFKSTITSMPLIGSVLIIGAFTTLIYTSSAWLKAFFGKPVEFDNSAMSKKEQISIMFLTVLIILLGLQFNLVYEITESAANAAFNTENYVQLVLGDTTK